MPDSSATLSEQPESPEAAPAGSPFAGNSVLTAAPLPEWEAATRTKSVLLWLSLVGVLAVLALTMTMSVQGSSQVALPGMSTPLPELCNARRFFGVECPGCGLTRSFISMGHGNVQAAWSFNPSGPLWFVAMLAQLPYRAAQLWYLRRGKKLALSANWSKWIWLVLVATLVGQWVVRGLIHLGA